MHRGRQKPLGKCGAVDAKPYFSTTPMFAISIACLIVFIAEASADVTTKPKPGLSYMDSSIGSAADGYRRAETDKELTDDQKKVLKKILKDAPVTTGLFAKLRKAQCPKINTFYIDGKNTPAQFARHAAKNGDCTMSLYFGHGIGSSRDGLDKSSHEEVKQAFDLLNLQSGSATSVSPKFGFWSCWAKQYNETVHEFFRVDFTWNNDKISRVDLMTKELASRKSDIETQLQILCEECRNNVTLNLYFGKMDGPKPGLKNEHGFSTWK